MAILLRSDLPRHQARKLHDDRTIAIRLLGTSRGCEIVQQVRDGRLRSNIGKVSTLDAVAALNSAERRGGKTIIRVRPEPTHTRTMMTESIASALRKARKHSRAI